MTAADKRLQIIGRSRGPFSAFDRDLFRYGDLLRSLFQRDVSLRYRQTLLGPVWIVLQPLLGAGVFTFLLGSVAGVDAPEGVPYFLFALVGLGLWTGFAQALTRSTSSMLNNSNLVSKVYFPRVLLPLSASLAVLVDCGVILGLALVIDLVAGPPFTWRLLFLPLILATLLAFTFCVGAFLSVLLVRFRDVSYGLPVLTQLLLFTTPVLYPLSAVPQDARLLTDLNPLTPLFEVLRWCVFASPMPSTPSLVFAGGAMLLVGLLSLLAFSRLERDVPDVI